jgi:hypothetical protein
MNCSGQTRYPGNERDQVMARIRTGNKTDFRSATFEIYLHDALIRLGYKLTHHPDPETGVSKRPDFMVRDAQGNEFFLEAVLSTERDGRNPAAEAMKKTALGYLNEKPHASFLIDIESEGDPTSQPSGKAISEAVHAWLEKLEPNSLLMQFTTHGPDAMPQMIWRHEGWEVRLKPIPLPADRRGKTNQLIGAQADGARLVNAWEPLREAVKKKATRYGNLTKPFVVAVNSDIFNLEQIDEVQALYGEEFWSEVVGYPSQSGPGRHPNGAWRGPHGPQNRRVSAVWFFNDLTPYTLANRRSTLYINPWANIQVPDGLKRIPTMQVEGNALIAKPGIELRNIYGLNADWPE